MTSRRQEVAGRGAIIGTVHRPIRGIVPLFVLISSVALLAASAACQREKPRPIIVANNVITVQNQSSEEWQAVEVWLNYHYRVTTPSMPPGERLGIPLDVFVASLGQRFNVKRQVVQTIQVKAKTKSGTPVDLMFGTGPKR
jgi:hypothetical protein